MLKTAKVGDKVICIDSEDAEEYLTFGKIYTIESIGKITIRLKETYEEWFTDRFKLLTNSVFSPYNQWEMKVSESNVG